MFFFNRYDVLLLPFARKVFDRVVPLSAVYADDDRKTKLGGELGPLSVIDRVSRPYRIRPVASSRPGVHTIGPTVYDADDLHLGLLV